MDIVDGSKRSKMMSNIQSKNTYPEIAIRKGLHRLGFRYRLHDSRLPGTPDIVLPKFKAVVLIHGCFWHGHRNCKYFKTPETNRDFWTHKIAKNVMHDTVVEQELTKQGWRIAVVWECSLKPKGNATLAIVLNDIQQWLTSPACRFETKMHYQN